MYYICIIISRRRGDRAHEMFIVSYQLTQRRPPHHKYKDRLNDSKFTSGILVDNWFIIPHTQCTHIKKLHSLWHFIISTRTDSMIPDSYLRFWRTNKSLFDTSNVPISNDFIVKLLTSGKRIWQWNWYFLPGRIQFFSNVSQPSCFFWCKFERVSGFQLCLLWLPNYSFSFITKSRGNTGKRDMQAYSQISCMFISSLSGSGSVILLRPKIGLAPQKHDVISMPRQQYTNTKHIPIESYHPVVSIMPRHMDQKKIFGQNLCCREVKINKISGGDLPYFSLKCDNLP